MAMLAVMRRGALPWACVLLIVAGTLLQVEATAATLELEAYRHQTTGCAFTGSTEGALGLSSNFTELSTEFAGGNRPSLSVMVVGSATLSLRNGVSWSRNQQLLPEVITANLSLHNSSSSNDKLTLPLRITQGGLHTFYLQTLGTSAQGFFESGHYRAFALFDCM